MRPATKTVATWFGILAGIAGLEHGYFEVLQGNTQPEGLMIASIGPPCVPEISWNACEPALTLFPTYQIAGVLTIIVSLVIIIWSVAFIQRKHGGSVLMLLSVGLLLTGGGIFPPLIGFIGGATGTRINKSLPEKSSSSALRLVEKLWPWPLVIFIVWTLGQFLIGYFFNDFLKSIMGFGVLLILSMLPLSIYSAYAHDVIHNVTPVEGYDNPMEQEMVFH